MMADVRGEVVFTIQRLSRLAGDPSRRTGLLAASRDHERSVEYFEADDVNVLLTVGADGVLRVRVEHETPRSAPVVGATVQLRGPSDGGGDTAPAVTDANGEAVLGDRDRLPRARADAPYRLFVRLPFGGDGTVAESHRGS
jgi:hypothetical protein